LQRQYKELAEMKRELEKVELHPSEETTEKILHYAKGLHEQKS
jgi:hypothetical protein